MIIGLLFILILEGMKTKVNYGVVSRINPQNKGEAPKFYGQIVSNQSISIEELAEVIAGRCTVKLADVIGVVTAFETEMKAALLNSEIVELDYIGRFRVTVSGSGTSSEEDYHPGKISKVSVRFAPAKYIKEELSKADFASKPLYIHETSASE